MERGKAFGNELAYTLMRCLKAGQDKELCETALALYDTAESINQKNFYLAPALLARLYGTEDCTEWIRAQFAAKKNSDQSIYVGEALTGICYDGKDWIMKTDFYPALQIQCVQKRVILNSGIEEGLTELLISYQTEDTDKILIQMAKQGKTIVMVSSEMPELLGTCDRILVMSGGKLAGEVDAKTATQEEIMTLAAKYV